MSKRLGLTIVLGIAGISAALAACGDDPAVSSGDGGGAGGDGSSGAPVVHAGTSNGGSSNPNGGAGGDADTAGQGGAGSSAAGAGGTPEGTAGETNAGGADGSGGAGGDAGVVYACKATTIVHKLCSALVAANCTDETICSDCVTTRNSDRASFAECASCAAEYDAFFQCGIDAYENDNLSAGIECYDGFGADLNDACAAHLNAALACQDYLLNNPCPETWPVN